jgi:nitric oxide reductase subunit B
VREQSMRPARLTVPSFTNLGAGLFGFFINPPIALFYMQGLNTTAVHGHTALFGVGPLQKATA